MHKRPLWLWLLFPALTMSLGWGLRGFIGGGPLGAMIPGALVAMCLCLLLERDGEDAAVIAAFGAVGIGFGGQETYGQTIGLAFQPETHWWGILGLAIKGAVWGLLGGVVVGLAFWRDRVSRRDIVIGFALMLAATYAGWRLINEPKLIYFSNRLDRPRPELYAGLLLGALALLGYLWRAIPKGFALWPAIGGGFGFGFGGWIQVMGRAYDPTPWLGWWKVMELHFGFCFGLALGYCAWKQREVLPGAEPRRSSSCLPALIVVPAALYAAGHIGSRMSYSILGAALMVLVLYRKDVAWHVAVTMTYCAYSIDFQRNRPQFDSWWLWVGIAASTAVIACLVSRWDRVTPIFLLLLWTAVANSMAKSFVPWKWQVESAVMEGVFVLLAGLSTILAGIIAKRSSTGNLSPARND